MTLYRVKLKLFDLTRYRIFLQIKVLECDAISLGKFRTYFQNSERSLSGEIGTFIPILIWKMLFHWYHLRNSIYIFFDIFAGGINVSAMWGKFYAKPHAACFFLMQFVSLFSRGLSTETWLTGARQAISLLREFRLFLSSHCRLDCCS